MNIEIFMDNTLKRFDKLYAAAGHPNCILEIDFEKIKQDYFIKSPGDNRVRKPTIIDYSLLCFLALIWSSAFLTLKLQQSPLDQ